MIEKKKFLTPGVELIIDRMEAGGFRADVVGGAVRNYLLGLDVSDYDITTDATPDEVEDLLSDLRIIRTGIKHGTLTVIALGESIEITTYRVDGGYLDHRHPDSVSFTKSLECDLERRDFTVNALCYNPKYGLTDSFGGRRDLENRIIRAVGDPVRRFNEDALRILRALRFASVLNFQIEDKTDAAVRECRELLRAPSRERICAEWQKLLLGSASHRIISEYREVIEVFLPEIECAVLPSEEKWQSAPAMVRFTSLFVQHTDAASRFAEAARRMRFDNGSISLGTRMLEYYKDERAGSSVGQRLILSKITEDHLRGVLALRALLDMNRTDEFEKLREITELGLVCRLSDLAVGGREIKSIGATGESVGKILSELLRAVIVGECENTPEALLKLASEINC